MNKTFPYIYFVSYSFTSEEGFGYGMIDIHRKRSVENFEDIVSLKKTIEEKYPRDVVILNYKLLGNN